MQVCTEGIPGAHTGPLKTSLERKPMPTNEHIIRDLYAAAEGQSFNAERFVAAFAEDGYMLDIPTGNRLQGQAMGVSLAGLTAAFPDIHRELLDIYVAGDVVVVELRIQGTHLGALGELAATGKRIDVPCCDVFRLQDGKVTAFHCYNAASIWQAQLGL
jgi:ketosteroid isomerase-like protein